MTNLIGPLTRRGLSSGRRVISDVSASILEPPINDERSIVLPEEMRRERIDWVLFVAAMALLGAGLVMVFSSTSFVAQSANHNPYGRVLEQALRGLAGMAFLVFLARIDYRRVSRWAMAGAVVSLVLLVAILVPGLGHMSKGATRWLVLGPIRLQPTELARVGLIVYLARLLSKPQEKIRNFTTGPLPVLVVAGVFALIIVIQPSLGSTLAVMATAVAMALLAGMRWRHLAMVTLPVLVLGAIFILVSGHRHWLRRPEAWVNFWRHRDDPLGDTYQTWQSLIAIGSGGFRGVGIGDSQQKRFFLPDAHTDFIYSILGEETGFIGAMIVLVLFAVLVMRGFRIAAEAEDRFGYLLAAGLTVNFLFYATVNIGVTMALFPVTGLPLPFVSYGGSALVANLAAIGLLLSVSRRRGGYLLAPSRGRRRGIA